MKITIATLETRSYSFTAVGLNQAEATEAMRVGWETHVARVGPGHGGSHDAELFTWDELKEDVGYVEMEPGQHARDGEVG